MTVAHGEDWDCEIKGEHYEPVSECCGAGMHSDVHAMCGACNEYTGWTCSLCEESMNHEVYS